MEQPRALQWLRRVHGGDRGGGKTITWSDPNLLESYIQHLHAAAERLTQENRKLRQVHGKMGEQVTELMQVSLLRQQNKWKDKVQALRDMADALQPHLPSLLSAVAHPAFCVPPSHGDEDALASAYTATQRRLGGLLRGRLAVVVARNDSFQHEPLRVGEQHGTDKGRVACHDERRQALGLARHERRLRAGDDGDALCHGRRRGP